MRYSNWIWIVVLVVVIIVGIHLMSSNEPVSDEPGVTESVATSSVESDGVGTPAEEQQIWLEMPAERKDGYYANAETITIMSNGERNYSCYYDFDTYENVGNYVVIADIQMIDGERYWTFYSISDYI